MERISKFTLDQVLNKRVLLGIFSYVGGTYSSFLEAKVIEVSPSKEYLVYEKYGLNMIKDWCKTEQFLLDVVEILE